jgi:hypothetical protein
VGVTVTEVCGNNSGVPERFSIIEELIHQQKFETGGNFNTFVLSDNMGMIRYFLLCETLLINITFLELVVLQLSVIGLIILQTNL